MLELVNEVRPYAVGKAKTVAFTGYRPEKLPFGDDWSCKKAKVLIAAVKDLYRILIKKGFCVFLVGGARGSDMIAARAITELQKEYKGLVPIQLFICLPCADFDIKWTEFDKNRFNALVNDGEMGGIYYVSNEEYQKGCMQTRNRFMVDRASILVAVYDGKLGGTRYTVNYARKKEMKMIVMDPVQLLRLDLIQSLEDLELAVFLETDEEDLDYLWVTGEDFDIARARHEAHIDDFESEKKFIEFMSLCDLVSSNRQKYPGGYKNAKNLKLMQQLDLFNSDPDDKERS